MVFKAAHDVDVMRPWPDTKPFACVRACVCVCVFIYISNTV